MKKAFFLLFFCCGHTWGLTQEVGIAHQIDVLRADLAAGKAKSVISRCEALSKICEREGRVDYLADVHTLWGHALSDLRGSLAHQNAQKQYETALQLRERHFGSYSAEAARSWLNLGNAHSVLFDTAGARFAYSKALTLSKALFGEKDTALLPSLQNLGWFYLRDNPDPIKSKRYLESGLQIAEGAFGHADNHLYPFLNGLATAWTKLGNDKEALGYYYRLESLCDKLGLQKSAENSIKMANAHEKTGDIEQARLCVDRALGQYASLPRTEAVCKGVVQAYLILGNLQQAKGDQAAAMATYQTCVDKSTKGAPGVLPTVYLQWCSAHLRAKNTQGAAKTLANAQKILRSETDKFIWCLRSGELALLQHQAHKALQYFETASTLVQGTYFSPRNLLAQAALVNARRQVARAHSDPSLWRDVLATARQTQALGDSLSAFGDADYRRVLQPAVRTACLCATEACFALKDTVNALYWAEAAKRNALNWMFESSKTTPSLSIGANLQQVLPTGKVCLNYLLSDDRIYIFAIRASGITAVTVPIDTAQMWQRITRFFGDCATSPRDLGEQKSIVYARLLENGRWFYENLVKLVLAPTDRSLVVVPDSWLHFLPFDAFLIHAAAQPDFFDQHEWLGSRYELQYLAAAALYGMDVPHPPADRLIWTIAPAFEVNAATFKFLPDNEAEASMVDSLFGKANITVGKTATRDLFLQQAGQYRILHLSTHGLANCRNPAYSCIAFAEDGGARPVVDAAEIANMDLHATEMVVLSACQTQFGLLAEGEGLVSLAWAFRRAGVSSLVASLWNVADQRSRLLQGYFYGALLEGETKSAALNTAKRNYLRASNREEAHPFYWAGIQLQGQDTPLFPKTAQQIGYWVIAGGFVLLFGIWVLGRKRIA